MSFDAVAADSYARFMGRYADPLAELFLAYAWADGIHDALDVGCGPGTLTEPLVERLGAERVSGIDPSASFVEAARRRCPGADVRHGCAQLLPPPPFRLDASAWTVRACV